MQHVAFERLKAENEALKKRLQEMSRDFAKVSREAEGWRDEFDRIESDRDEEYEYEKSEERVKRSVDSIGGFLHDEAAV